MRIAFLVPAALVIFAGFYSTADFLSKKDNKWLGLMLPIICFCIALAGSVYQIYEWSATGDGNTATSAFGWVSVTAAFFFTNIPTVILLVIYFACREKQRRKKPLTK